MQEHNSNKKPEPSQSPGGPLHEPTHRAQQRTSPHPRVPRASLTFPPISRLLRYYFKPPYLRSSQARKALTFSPLCSSTLLESMAAAPAADMATLLRRSPSRECRPAAGRDALGFANSICSWRAARKGSFCCAVRRNRSGGGVAASLSNGPVNLVSSSVFFPLLCVCVCVCFFLDSGVGGLGTKWREDWLFVWSLMP